MSHLKKLKLFAFMKSLVLHLLAVLAIFAGNTAHSQTFENVFFNGAEFENESVKVIIDDVVSLPKETKFRMTIINKTNQYLIYNSEESNFDIPGQDVRAKEKSWLIEPLATKKKVMRAFGTGLNEIRTFAYVCEGFYRLEEQAPFSVDQFRLPPAANSFNAGEMMVVLNKEKRATGSTSLKLDVTNKGKNHGFIYPYKVKVLMPDGNFYASNITQTDPTILEPGETGSLLAGWDRMPGGSVNDMQKVPMMVDFEGVFVEAKPEKIPGSTLTFTWNQALTEEKK
jgi:hypothetical protein